MRWYDPIEQKWHDPAPPKPVEIVTVHEDEYTAARRRAMERIIWAAVHDTAMASQMGEARETELPIWETHWRGSARRPDH